MKALFFAALLCLPIITSAQQGMRYHGSGALGGTFRAKLDAFAIGFDSTDRNPDWRGPRDLAFSIGSTQAEENATHFTSSVTLRGKWQRDHSLRFGFNYFRAPLADSLDYLELGKRRYFAAVAGGTYAPAQNNDLTFVVRYGLNIGVGQTAFPNRPNRWATKLAFGPSFDAWLAWGEESVWGGSLKLDAMFGTPDAFAEVEVFRMFAGDLFSESTRGGLGLGLRYDAGQAGLFFSLRFTQL